MSMLRSYRRQLRRPLLTDTTLEQMRLAFLLFLLCFMCFTRNTIASCTTIDDNRAKINEQIAAHIKRAEEEIKECNTKTMAGEQTRTPYKRDIDENGDVHNYKGIVNSSGEVIRWEKTEDNPNSSEDNLGGDPDCFNEAEYESILNALTAMRDAVDKIPCGIKIINISCGVKAILGQPVTYETDCLITTIPVPQLANSTTSAGGNSSLDGFLQALKESEKRRDNVNTHIIDEKPFPQSDVSPKKDLESSDAIRTVDDILANSTPLSRIDGDHGVSNDGIPFVKIKEEDGSVAELWDSDGDNRPDFARISSPDDFQLLLIDSDRDGRLDTKSWSDENGQHHYEAITNESNRTSSDNYNASSNKSSAGGSSGADITDGLDFSNNNATSSPSSTFSETPGSVSIYGKIAKQTDEAADQLDNASDFAAAAGGVAGNGMLTGGGELASKMSNVNSVGSAAAAIADYVQNPSDDSRWSAVKSVGKTAIGFISDIAGAAAAGISHIPDLLDVLPTTYEAAMSEMMGTFSPDFVPNPPTVFKPTFDWLDTWVMPIGTGDNGE